MSKNQYLPFNKILILLLNFSQPKMPFSYGKKHDSSFRQTWIDRYPSPVDALCQVWLKLSQWFLKKRYECEKKTTDKRQTSRKAYLNLQLRLATNLCFIHLVKILVKNLHILSKLLISNIWQKLNYIFSCTAGPLTAIDTCLHN